ncbi:fungal pheromone mating factor STE2 GPCR-domain-containing protein [Cladorrhinum sp. PSN259]|nr:fungal pheromone mating factor STE2 GPCR-domain-containing protein [Cladorrhinum sp. PSN259]
MASNNTTTGPSSNASGPAGPFDPLKQVFFILGPDGTTKIPLTPQVVSSIYADVASLATLYGSQIGACFIMLAVLLLMTPRVRLTRLPTIISILGLTLNMIRMVLLSLFYPSAWTGFYTIFAMDYQFVPRIDYNISVAATCLSVPVTMLIMAALFVQAWSMVQLWRGAYKWSVTALSLALVLTTVGFNFAGSIIQARSILSTEVPRLEIWVRKTYLGLITASICWFCFLFNVRLVMHMWTNRSLLPSLKGLKAMDVLVITNGILMFVPVVFAGLEFAQFPNFESASLTQTSVIVVLPLGTLVAQRLASPRWFNSDGDPSGAASHPSGSNQTGSTNNTGRPLLASHKSPRHQSAGITSYVVAEPSYRHGSAATEKGAQVSHAEEDYGNKRGMQDRQLPSDHSGSGRIRVEQRVERHEESVSGSRSRRGSLSPTTGNMES